MEPKPPEGIRYDDKLSGSFKEIIPWFFPLPLLPTLCLPDLLASHFRTDWLSRLGLGNQVG